jgi:hypothetical protein
MKVQLLLPDLVALLEVVNEHIDRTFPGVDAPLPLRKLRTKLIHMTRMYPEVHDRTAGRSRPAPMSRGRGRTLGKAIGAKAVRKRRPQTQTSR